MTGTSSSALEAMRAAEVEISRALEAVSRGCSVHGSLMAARNILRVAIVQERADYDPRVEVLARVLEPDAFNENCDNWTVGQLAELREIAFRTARRQLAALDAFEAPSNAALVDATIGR